MYPLHLEKQEEDLYKKAFLQSAASFNRQVLKFLQQGTRVDSHNRVIRDADIFSWLNDLQNRTGGVSQEKLLAELLMNKKLLSAFSSSQVKRNIEAAVSSLAAGSPPSVAAVRPGAKDGISERLLEGIAKTGVQLITGLQKKHQDTVAQIVARGLASGKSNSQIAEEMNHVMNVGVGQAQFRGRDQASKFYSQVTKIRQSEAGFPGYIWRTLMDGRVRDRHAALEGKYFKWTNPPRSGTKGEFLHPGEDYNCRCYAEGSFGEEADREFEQTPLSGSGRGRSFGGDDTFDTLPDPRIKSMDAKIETMSKSSLSRQMKNFRDEFQDLNKSQRIEKLNALVKGADWDSQNYL
ncbi:MAG: minor capsid protein, partial [Leptospiraceae bacterium]|nr:minor capsid protein [Leptospiraceae bacterium]